jgi:hypothetical protein
VALGKYSLNSSNTCCSYVAHCCFRPLIFSGILILSAVCHQPDDLLPEN